MDYHALTQDQYDSLVRDLVKLTESLHARSQDVGDGRATIGYGYTFNRANNVDLWRASGIGLTQGEWQQLSAIDAAAPRDRTRLGLAFSRQLTPAEGDSLLTASLSEYERPIAGLNMPVSQERAALVSLVYNRGPGAYQNTMQPFRDAVAAGDRAEAWFEMRYNAWGSNQNFESGLRKRRYMESELFGLYDDPHDVSAEDAASVYRMYQLHRDRINGDEQRWGVDIDGNPGQRNLVAEANRDYAGILRTRGNVQTISEALEPARTRLLSELRRQYPEISESLGEQSFNAGSIHVAPGRESARISVDLGHPATLNATRTRHGTEIVNDDLLLGSGGDDTLIGARGDDVLIGGGGRNTLRGGEGNDSYLVNGGDIVQDSDGLGRIVWNGRHLDSVGWQRGEEGMFHSEDGRFTGRMDGADLIITNDQNESITVRNHQPGHLGIDLDDTRQRDLGESRRESLTQSPQADATSRSSTPHLSTAEGRQSGDTRFEHPLLRQSREAVARLDEKMGRTPDQASERMSASLACLAHQSGLTRIDHVVLSVGGAGSQPGENVFVVEGRLDDPAHLRAHMKTGIATQTPVDESLRLLQITQAPAPELATQSQVQTQRESHGRVMT